MAVTSYLTVQKSDYLEIPELTGYIFSRVFSDSVENGSNIKLDMAELVVYRNRL